MYSYTTHVLIEYIIVSRFVVCDHILMHARHMNSFENTGHVRHVAYNANLLALSSLCYIPDYVIANLQATLHANYYILELSLLFYASSDGLVNTSMYWVLDFVV